MEIEPLSLEQLLKVERLKRHVKDMPREELEEYTRRLIAVTAKLTHQTKQLLRHVAESELGLLPDEHKI